MTEQDLIKFKNLSMQDGKLNLQWFADYVAQAERAEIAEMVKPVDESLADEILARGNE